eukprot:scaffold290089_cov39-Tisochrysis_lutea.AAC.2
MRGALERGWEDEASTMPFCIAPIRIAPAAGADTRSANSHDESRRAPILSARDDSSILASSHIKYRTVETAAFMDMP